MINKKSKKENGITLVALIITIIILIILAAVTINSVFKSNFIDLATQGTLNYAEAQVQEEKKLGDVSQLLENTIDSIGAVENTTTNKPGPSESPVIPEDPYLVDEIEIGDYIDINLDYENKQEFVRNSDSELTESLTGWRVLSRTGSGVNGQIKLITAGCPITYYHYYTIQDTELAIQNLEDLYKTITLVTTGTGFKENGFGDNNLQNIFTEEKYIDISKGVHAFGCSEGWEVSAEGPKATKYSPLNEIEEAYKELTGTEQNMPGLSDLGSGVINKQLKLVAGEKWKEKYNNLLVNCQSYLLGGSSYSAYNIWRIRYDGATRNGAEGTSRSSTCNHSKIWYSN